MSERAQQALEDAITLLAKLADGKGYVLNRVKLAKLLYFLDLQSWEETGRLMTGVEWQWLDHGPYAGSIPAATTRMSKQGELEVRELGTNFGNTEYRIRPTRPQYFVEPGSHIIALATKVVDEYGAYTAKALKNLSYETEPMLRVQKQGKRGDPLEFPIRAPSRTAVQRALARFALLAKATEGQDEGDVAGALREDMNALSGARSSANRILLDDE